MADRLVSEEAAINALRVAYWDDNIQSAKDDPCIVDAMTDWAILRVKALPTAQPEVQLSPIEQALHGLSPEEQADFLINLMRGTLAYIDSRVALIRWLKEGKWNE